MRKVVAAAPKSLPGFKALDDHLSSMAHPSGARAFQTFQLGEDGAFVWQSNPTFRSTAKALPILNWLEEVRGLSARVIEETSAAFRAAEVGEIAG